MEIRSPRPLTVVLCTCLSLSSMGLFAQPLQLTSLPNGIDLRAAEMREQITALRDDLLRVRIVRTGQLPEDASWAVLPEARTSSANVTPEINAGSVGFRTRVLRVVVDRKTLRMAVLDLAGNVLLEDARRAQFEGTAFRIFKTMPVDEHYFGL
jgi:alpha-glucosidase